MRVLIVDDSPQVASTLEIAHSHAGWETSCAHDAIRALELLSTLPAVDVIVTDLDMPRLDGYAFIAAIRAHPRASRSAVIVTSGSTAADAEKLALAAGADLYFAKPYSPASVRQSMERLAGGHNGQVIS